MTNSWSERAKAAFLQKGQDRTAKTDESTLERLSSVSSVPAKGVFPIKKRLSSVSSVPPPVVLKKPIDWLARLKEYEAARERAKTAAAKPEPPANPDDWRSLAQAYRAHYFRCHVCIAAGRGSKYGLRCGAGAALWMAYGQ